jgi:hypothetical protein
MVLYKSLVSLFLLCSTHQIVSCFVVERHDDIHALTSFTFDASCGAREVSIIKQANQDAIELATAALDHSDHELSMSPAHLTIDFDQEAAVDYFGPPSQNLGSRQRIFDTLYTATQTTRGWGLSDWWKSRYVEVVCDYDCHDAIAHYERGEKYPRIVYCADYFDSLRDHSYQVNRIKQDSTGQMKRNVANLRSRGEKKQ